MSIGGLAKRTDEGHTVCLNSEHVEIILITAQYNMLYPSTLENTPPTMEITPCGKSAICVTSSPDERDLTTPVRMRAPSRAATFRFVIKTADFINNIIPSIFFLLFSRITYLVAIKIFI